MATKPQDQIEISELRAAFDNEDASALRELLKNLDGNKKDLSPEAARLLLGAARGIVGMESTTGISMFGKNPVDSVVSRMLNKPKAIAEVRAQYIAQQVHRAEHGLTN